MQIIVKLIFLGILGISALIFAKPESALAADCLTPPSSGIYTLTFSCSFSGTGVVEVPNVNVNFNPGVTLTVRSGQTIVFGPGQQINNSARGVIVREAGGEIRKTRVWVIDADGDLYAGDLAPVFANDSPGVNYARRYLMQSLTQLDCADWDSNYNLSCPMPEVETWGVVNGTRLVTFIGNVNPHGYDTTNWIRYSISRPSSCDNNFGTATSPTYPFSGEGWYQFHRDVSVQPNTTYYYCAISQNVYGIAYGTVQSVRTYPVYTLTVNNGSGGGSYASGETVSISANSAPSGQVFDYWSGCSCFANAGSSGTTLTMPANALTVVANYRNLPPPPVYNLYVNNGTKGTNCTFLCTAGTVVEIYANSATYPTVFSGWTGAAVENSGSANTRLTMPSNDVTVTANYYTYSWHYCGPEQWPIPSPNPPPPYPRPSNYCDFTGNIIFGEGSRWSSYRWFNGGTWCNINVFGDPSPGRSKACWAWY